MPYFLRSTFLQQTVQTSIVFYCLSRFQNIRFQIIDELEDDDAAEIAPPRHYSLASNNTLHLHAVWRRQWTS